jgi:hypothetical protein
MEIAMQAAPFFKDATPREIRLMRFWIGANIAVILFCTSWLLLYFTAAGLSLLPLMATLLAGYFVADFSSGAVHWAMDTWFDQRSMGRAIAITREHHTHPDHIYGFLENASFGSAPSAVTFGFAAVVTALFPVSVFTWTLMLLWLISSTCLLFGMHFHNLAHKPARSAVMRLAQRIHLVCPPAHHWVHHHNHTIHYCVVNGWANYVCDHLYVWRGLEHMIAAVTGLVPRADDAAWQRQYRETGTLSVPRS